MNRLATGLWVPNGVVGPGHIHAKSASRRASEPSSGACGCRSLDEDLEAPGSEDLIEGIDELGAPIPQKGPCAGELVAVTTEEVARCLGGTGCGVHSGVLEDLPHGGGSEAVAEPGGRWGWVQCPTMRRRCQPNSVSGVTSHPARLGRASAAAIAPSKLRSASVSSGRSTCRRSTPSWWRNTMISRSFERRERTVGRASGARNRYKIRYTRTQDRPASRQVNDHGRVSGTHTPSRPTFSTLLAFTSEMPFFSAQCVL